MAKRRLWAVIVLGFFTASLYIWFGTKEITVSGKNITVRSMWGTKKLNASRVNAVHTSVLSLTIDLAAGRATENKPLVFWKPLMSGLDSVAEAWDA